jgi:hypothetical protein
MWRSHRRVKHASQLIVEMIFQFAADGINNSL